MTNDAELLESINIDVFPDGQAVSFEAVFGNSATFDDSGAIVSAVAMTQVGCLLIVSLPSLCSCPGCFECRLERYH